MTSRTKLRASGIVGLALIGCVVLLWGAGAFEADAVTADNHYEGTVISAGDSTLMIQSVPDNDTFTFRVEPNAQITKDGQRVSLEKVTSGDSVTVVFTTGKNESIATSIAAHSSY